ncbi:MAG TPA: hypothetical protein VEP94_06590 [Solirubrobacterales bacterium]|nr:hypothetical protein [Solirubrobacterales bacterium]
MGRRWYATRFHPSRGDNDGDLPDVGDTEFWEDGDWRPYSIAAFQERERAGKSLSREPGDREQFLALKDRLFSDEAIEAAGDAMEQEPNDEGEWTVIARAGLAAAWNLATGHGLFPLTQQSVDPEVPRCGGSGLVAVEGLPVPGQSGAIGVPESKLCPGCLDCQKWPEHLVVQRELRDGASHFTVLDGKQDTDFENCNLYLLQPDCQSTPELLGEGKSSDEDKAVNVLRRFMCCKAGEQFVDEKLLRPFGFTLDAGPVVRANRNLVDALEWIEVETQEMHTRDAAHRAVDANKAASTQPESPGNSGEARLVEDEGVARWLFVRFAEGSNEDKLRAWPRRDVYDAWMAEARDLLASVRLQPVPGNSGSLAFSADERAAILRALEEDDNDPGCCSTCAGAVSAKQKLEATRPAGNSGGVEEKPTIRFTTVEVSTAKDFRHLEQWPAGFTLCGEDMFPPADADGKPPRIGFSRGGGTSGKEPCSECVRRAQHYRSEYRITVSGLEAAEFHDAIPAEPPASTPPPSPEAICTCVGEREEAPPEPDPACPIHGADPSPQAEVQEGERVVQSGRTEAGAEYRAHFTGDPEPETVKAVETLVDAAHAKMSAEAEGRCGGTGELWTQPPEGHIGSMKRPCPGCADCTGKQSPAELPDLEGIHDWPSPAELQGVWCPKCRKRIKPTATDECPECGSFQYTDDPESRRSAYGAAAELQGDVVESALLSDAAVQALYCHLPEIRSDNDAGPTAQEESALVDALEAVLATITPLLPGSNYALELRERLEERQKHIVDVLARSSVEVAEHEWESGEEEAGYRLALRLEAGRLDGLLAALDRKDSGA